MSVLSTMKIEMKSILEENILSFWMQRMIDTENGGFYGRITGENITVPTADKGSVLNARILWTFAAAYRLTGNDEYLRIASRAYRYLVTYFFDKKMGGVYWTVDYKGNPADDKKQIYALAFAIYGLSEYARAANHKDALEHAVALFRTIEHASFDTKNNGYFEAFTRDWKLLDDMRLSQKDANEQKTMNTHLHILEAYTNLYRVWKDDGLKQQLRNLTTLFLDKIIHPDTHHLRLFWDVEWQDKSNSYSFGHDIETSWLLYEAAAVLDDDAIRARVKNIIPPIIRAVDDGLLDDGSLAYEYYPETKHMDTEKHWWVQNEAILGFLTHYQLFGKKSSLKKAVRCWEYVKKHLIDYEHGEWYWSAFDDGSVNTYEDKAGIWKCPYHNGRMCLEILYREGL